MKKYELIKVVDKLTGRCYPCGDTSVDEKRYENLELKIALAKDLIDEIEEAGRLYNRSEFSIQRIANRANSFLTDMRDTLLDIEYLPPFELDIEYLPSFEPIDSEVEQ